MRGAELLGCSNAVGEHVGGDDRRRACESQELHEDEAERAAAEDACAGAGADMPEVERVQRHAERLCERGLDVGERPRAPDAARRSGHGRSVRRAPSVEPWPAKRTAGQRCSSPAVQRSQAPHGTAGSTATRSPSRRPESDDAGELVPEHEWMLELGVADPALEQPVSIRPAQTHGGDAHEHLPRRRQRVGLVVQPQLVRRVQPERPQPLCP